MIPHLIRTMGHYVNRPVRGFRLPGSRRISSASFGPSRLRMRRIIRPRVVVPAIKSAPVAADSVATIAHLAFSLAGTILIPDCARPCDFRPRSSRSSRRLLFTVAGVVGPDLPHGELPSLQLTTQPLLHRLGAQRNSAAGAGRGHAIQSGVGVRQASGVPTQHTVVGVVQPDPPADNQQQRVQPPMHGWFFQAPYDTQSSRAPQATRLLVRHPLPEQIGRHRGKVGVDEIALQRAVGRHRPRQRHPPLPLEPPQHVAHPYQQ